MDLSHSETQGQDKTKSKKSSNFAGTSFEETRYEFEQTEVDTPGSTSQSHSTVKPEKFKRNSKRNSGSISNPINNSWIEQIHFKAQYNHYRTNNYASVVNSSSSLDKVGIGTSQAGHIPETRLEASAAGAGVVGTKERERHSLCWNFPRVKLPQIFNAKSLDDILGRNNVRVKIKHKNPNSTNPGPETSISNSSISSSSAPGVISPARTPQRPQIRYQCEVTPPSPKINLSTSSSDNNCYAVAGKNVFLAVPHQEVGKKHSHGKHSHGRSRSRVKVATTKSDNCIHRISTDDAHTSSKTSSSCGKAFKIPCGSNSVNDLDVLESVYILPTSPSPTDVDDTRIPHKNRQKKIGFSNRVTPIIYSPDNEMAQISENQPKLVVASVSFLQRPISPLPPSSATVSQLPSPMEGETVRVSSSNNKILSSNVFNKLTSYNNSSGGERTMSQNGFKNNNKKDTMKSGSHVRFGESSYNDSANSHHLLKSTHPDPERTQFMNFKCCGFGSNDQNQNGGTSGAGVTRVHAQSQSTAQKKCFQEQSRSRGESSRATPGDRNNSSAIDFFKNRCDQKSEHDTGQEDDQNQKEINPNPEMGDLQSPQYVKRTAHMFNSRYAATTSHNGSAVSDENRKITPSYLNVSRSISGYSCLSYNGSSNGYHGSHGGPNGTGTGKIAQSPHRTTTTGYSNGSKFSHNGSHSHSSESDYSIKYKSTHNSSSGGQYDDPDGPPPPPLPKTAPPLYSPALKVGSSGAGHSRVIDIPIVREKSPFILNRIERLCGSSEVMSSWRRPGTKTPPQPMRAQEKIIPIVLEDNEDQNYAVKSCQGRHNLLTDIDNASVGIDDDGVAGRRPELGKCANYSKDKQKMQIRDDEDSLDGENSRKAIPVHRNGNFKDWYDIGSKIDIEETGESGVLLYGNSKSMQLKSPQKSVESDCSVTDLEVQRVIFPSKTPTEGHGEDLTMADTATVKRHPLTQVLKANPAATSLVVDPKDETKKFSGSGKGMPSLNKENEQISAIAAVEKNGDYFLLEMDKERSKLEKLVETASEQLNALDSSSDEAGKIRAAIGKANLLCTKKFKQFKELCHTNLEQSRKGASSEPFTTKNDDLAGFWDMVLIQVGQIHSMFEELNPNRTRTALGPDSAVSAPTIPRAPVNSRRSNSAKTSPTNAGTSSKLSSSKAAQPKSESSALRDESRRKLLAEKRRAMKNQITDSETHCEPEVQIFTPSSN